MDAWQTALLGPIAGLAGALIAVIMLWRKLEAKDAYIVAMAEAHSANQAAMIRESNTALNANTAAMVALTNAIARSNIKSTP